MSVDFQVRFWKKVDKDGPHAPGMLSRCWAWLGATDKDGYGVFGVSTKVKSARAHRVAYQLQRGDPGRLQVLHECDNPSCVNPAHLFLGTPLDNMQDKVKKGRHVGGMSVRPERAARGSAHGNAELTEEQVLELRAQYAPRRTPLRVFADRYGVAVSTIHYALKTGWRHVRVC